MKFSVNGYDILNAFLEGALLHLRNLYDFFCGLETEKDDIRASHFVPRATGQLRWTSSKLDTVKSLIPTINKSLSHLTYTRISRKPKWPLKKLAQEIEYAYAEFKSLLPDSERGQWPS